MKSVANKAGYAVMCMMIALMRTFAATNIVGTVTLNGDTDWTEYGTVTLESGAVLDLKGYDLRVAGLNGSGRIVSSENVIENGSFETYTSAISGTNGDFSETLQPISWLVGNSPDGSSSIGFYKSKDSTWSNKFDAKDGSYGIWIWCRNSTSGGAQVSQVVNITKAGWYRLEFWTAARPGNDKYQNMRIHADVDGVSRGYAVCSATSWKKTSIDIMLTSGEHTIGFRSDGTGGGQNPCGLCDNISLRRIPAFYLGRAAGATYFCQNISLENVSPFAENQTLVADCDWRGLGTVNISDGATLDLNGYNLASDGISYDANEREYLGVELVSNGNFEKFVGTPAANVANAQLNDDVHFDSWGWVDMQTKAHSLWVKTSGWCSNSKDGSYYVGYWLMTSLDSNAMSLTTQTVSVPRSGVYRLSYWVAARTGNNTYKTLYIHADVDGISRGFVACNSTTWQEKVIDLNLTAGEHELSFRVVGTMGNPCGGLDKVSIKRITGIAITNSNENATSELRFDIGEKTTNDIVPIGGNIKFVKGGAGTFVSAITQTYSGGTVVAGGTVQPPDGTGANDAYSGTKFRAYGTGALTICEGGVFDLRGNYDYKYIMLDGGTLRNSGFQMTQTNWGGAEVIAVTKDSFLDVQKSLVLGGDTLNLASKTVTVAVAESNALQLKCPNVVNGTLVTEGTGWLVFVNNCNMRTARLLMKSPIAIEVDVDVDDYIVEYTGNESKGGKALNVFGTFKPNTDNFYGCTMQDGSTIDLSERTTTLPITSALATSTGKTRPSSVNILFATGATVNVKLGTRKISVGDKVIGWTSASKPANLESLKFISDAAERNYGLVKRDDGLYVVPNAFMIILK